MSEFSESYHLKSDRIEDALEVLNASKLKGYVFPKAFGWISFVASVPADNRFEPYKKIVDVNPGRLLHYVFTEDYGWSFALFDKKQPTLAYRCDWDPDLHVEDVLCPRQQLREFLSETPETEFARIWKALHPVNVDELIDAAEEPAKLFAKSLRIEYYNWLAYDYIAKDYRKTPASYPEVIVIE